MNLPSALLFACALPAAAHHGRDFLLVQDASVPAPFTGILYNNQELATHTGPDEWSIEPGIQYGLGYGLSLGAAVTLMDEGEGMDYASFSPQLQWEINPGGKGRARLSLLAGYQFGEQEEAAHDHGEEETPCGPEYGPDAPACDEVAEHEHTHTHSGIHQHGVDSFFGRLIMETDLTANTKLALNLLGVVPDGDSVQWGYAAGLRHAFSHKFALGVEALGDFQAAGYHEIAAAAYWSPAHHLTFKCGIGTGLTDASPDLTVHTGVLFRF